MIQFSPPYNFSCFKTSPPSFPLENNKRKLLYIIVRILQIILPRTWFCWLTRSVSQVQSILRPRKWAYWSKLTDNIYLGAMPLKNRKHIDKIVKLDVKAILSINEDYEFKKQLFANPVKPIDWKKRHISFLRIPSPDLKPVKVAHLAQAVDYVEKKVRSGKKVFIHCTAGRGRSVSAAICALVRTEGFTLKRSIQHVTQCRRQCFLTPKQMESVKIWYKMEKSLS